MLSCKEANLCRFFFKQKTAYEMRISDWSSDVCSSDLQAWRARHRPDPRQGFGVAVERLAAGRIGFEAHREARQAVRIGQPPWLRRVGDIAVAEQDHRRHDLDGAAHTLNDDISTYGRRALDPHHHPALTSEPHDRA